MSGILAFIRRWLPAISIMVTIFAFSSIPSYEMPNFAWADTLVKKGGHMLGYGLLALAYMWGLRAACPACTPFGPRARRGETACASTPFAARRCETAGGGQAWERSDPKGSAVAAWLLALLYACSDEFHQIFVAGRHASLLDIGIDAIGAAIALAAWIWFRKRAFRNSGISHR
jgi:VanZ family protein